MISFKDGSKTYSKAWQAVRFFFLIFSIGLTKYSQVESLRPTVSILFVVLICYQILSNFVAGVLFLVSLMISLVLLSFFDLSGYISAFLVGLVATSVLLVYESQQSKQGRVVLKSEKKFTQNSFLVVVIISLFQYGSSILGNSATRLSSNLLSYDSVAHSYLTRVIAICDSSVENCSTTLPDVAKSEFINSYPDAFHNFFATIYRSSLIGNVDDFLLAWNMIVMSAFAIALSLLLGSLNYLFNTRLQEQSNESDVLGLKIFHPLVFLIIGIGVIYCFNLGYLNFGLSIAFVCCSIATLIKNRLVLSFGILFLSCELWTFLYLVTPIIFLYILFKMFTRNKLLSIFLFLFYAYFLFNFLSLALSSTQAKAIELNGNRTWEPVLILLVGALLLKFLRSKKSQPAFILSIYLIAIGFNILIGMTFLFFVEGITGSYYVFKAIVVLALVECIAILYLATSYHVVHSVSRKSRFQLLSIWLESFRITPVSLMNVTVIFALLFWLIPTSMLISIKSTAQSPISILLARLNTQDVYYQRSLQILTEEASCKAKVPCVLLEPYYWYQSTQWINNLNLSWTDEIQREMDIVFQDFDPSRTKLDEVSKSFRVITPGRTIIKIEGD